VLWGGFGPPMGPKVVPGKYQVRISSGTWTQTQPFELEGDPRLPTTQADYEAQAKMANEIGGRLKLLYDNLATLRSVKEQATQLGERMEKAGMGDEISKAAKSLGEKLRSVEGKFTQLQGEGGQDALNFPGMLDNQFVEVYNEVADEDKKPTRGATERWAEVNPQLDVLMAELNRALSTDVAAFNEQVRKTSAAPIIIGKPAGGR
jgi:hypothetical protein